MRVVRLRTSKEAVIDPLGDDDVGELDVAHASVLESLLDGLDLSFDHVRDLPITYSIPGSIRFMKMRVKQDFSFTCT